MTANDNPLAALSQQISSLVDGVAASIVRVDDGSRLTASGIVWERGGVIVTTSHGVERDDDLAVELGDGTVHAATLVGRDADTDIAVLRTEAANMRAIGRADGDAARIGALALAVGRPGQAGLQVTLGVVTSRTETQSGGRSEYLLHTDADMYPGFSGGALVDMQGNLLGLTNLMFGRGRGIAIGTPIVANVTQALLVNGRIQRGYLGVRTQQVNVPASISHVIAWPQERALLVAQVEPGSPADAAGLLLGDTLLRIGEAVTEDADTLRRNLRVNGPGASVSIDLVRGGDVISVAVVLGTE